MTTTYFDTSRPDWTPGPLGRDASELAKISASPKGWIYTFSPILRNISSATWTGGAATITVPAHGFIVGDSVTIAGVTVNTGYNGTFTIATTPTADTFTYAVADPGGAGTTTAATASYATSSNIEVLTALRQLDSKITGQTDAETLPTFTAAFTSSANTGGILSTIDVAVGGTGYGVSTDPIPVTISGGGASVQATAHAVADAGGVITSFVVDTPGTGYLSTPTIVVGGTGTDGAGTPNLTAFNVVTAAVLKVTLTASEAVYVSGTPKIAVTIGVNTRQFTYDSALSDSTHLVFKYTVVAGDDALVTEVVSGATVNISGTYDGIGDALTATGGTNWLTSVAFTAPVLTNVSVN